MMARSCTEIVKEALGKDATDDDANKLIARAGQVKAKAAASGKVPTDLLKEQIGREAVAAAAEIRRAKIDTLKRIEVEDRIDQYMADGLSPDKAVLALLEGTNTRTTGGSRSVYAAQEAAEALHVGGMFAELSKEVPHFHRMVDDRQFGNDLATEMYELRDGGTPGSSKNPDAQKAAAVFAKHTEAARLEANRHGAFIGKLDGWVPQSHAQEKLITVAGKSVNEKAKAWTNIIAPLLDMERTFPGSSKAEIEHVLRDIYAEIATGVTRDDASGRKGAANLANSLGKERVLHFKDVNARNAYDAQFGNGNLTAQLFAHQKSMAGAIGQMSVLGTNPDNMVRSIAKKLQKEVVAADLDIKTQSKQIKALDTESRSTALAQALEALNGVKNANANNLLAKVGSGFRSFMTMAKLGGMVLTSAPTDMMQRAWADGFRGSSRMGALSRHLGSLSRGRGSAETRELAAHLGEGFDAILGEAIGNKMALDGVPGAVSRMAETFFKYTGQGWLDDVSRSGVARATSAEMASRVKIPFGELPQRYRQTLDQHGITPEIWSKLSGLEGGHVTPQAVMAIPGLEEGEARDLAMHVASFVGSEVRNSILQISPKTRRQVAMGTQTGTVAGELTRTLLLFKSFTLEYGNSVLGRAWSGAEGGAQRATNLGSLLVMLTVGGYVSGALKDLVQNKTPRNPLDIGTITDAMLRGGGLGIYGDVLLGKAEKFGTSAWGTVAGPGVSTIVDAITVFQQAKAGELKAAKGLNFIINNTPFANLFYLRPAMNALFLNSVREAASPGFKTRQQAQMKGAGQRPIVGPGGVVDTR
jgi:hypothetical protein